MSLATRCTACGTVFRVVQDQLKISEGWVRCGRCKEVFNALEGLFDLDREAPPPWQPPAPPPVAESGVDVSLPVDEAKAEEAKRIANNRRFLAASPGCAHAVVRQPCCERRSCGFRGCPARHRGSCSRGARAPFR